MSILSVDAFEKALVDNNWHAVHQHDDSLREALENIAIHGVTAGANPQRDGTFSPPLWHMECSLCGSRWSKQQKRQPREHPPHESCPVRHKRGFR